MAWYVVFRVLSSLTTASPREQELVACCHLSRKIAYIIDYGCNLYGSTPGVCVWGTLMFSYMRRLGSVLWVQNFEFQYFFGFSGK